MDIPIEELVVVLEKARELMRADNPLLNCSYCDKINHTWHVDGCPIKNLSRAMSKYEDVKSTIQSPVRW